MSLIECVAVVAVLAVLTVAMVPVTVRHLDQLASDQETASLKALGDALVARIVATRHIPNQTDWATQIATQTGSDVAAVTNNLRNRARVFLADPSGWFSSNLPYTQTNTGTASAPSNARIMLVSSIGAAVPMTNGMPTASDFATLWGEASGIVPTNGAWTGWTGRAEDVKIYRINLSPLFVNLALSTYNTYSNGQYAIDGSTLLQAPPNNGVTGYFLQGTALKLYTGMPSNTLDSTQILTRDVSFVYEAGVWKDSIRGDPPFGLGDISGVVAAFLAAPTNSLAATPTQQVAVVQSMINYMSNYNNWAAGNFTDNSLKNYLKNTLQPAMISAVQGLYTGSNYPTNAGACN
jgi:type II secretory pathway pseudopilin PulG